MYLKIMTLGVLEKYILKKYDVKVFEKKNIFYGNHLQWASFKKVYFKNSLKLKMLKKIISKLTTLKIFYIGSPCTNIFKKSMTVVVLRHIFKIHNIRCL